MKKLENSTLRSQMLIRLYLTQLLEENTNKNKIIRNMPIHSLEAVVVDGAIMEVVIQLKQSKQIIRRNGMKHS